MIILAVLTGAMSSYNIGEKEIIGILFNIMPNVRSKEACAKVFYCETITY